MFQRHLLIRSLIAHLLVLTTLSLGGDLWPVAQAQEYAPPNRGLPGRREGGGTRGSCLRSDTSLLALIPTTNYGTTLEPYPTFYWYIPQSSAHLAEFVLLDADDNEVYKTTFELKQAPGIISFSLPTTSDMPPLELGKDYHWYFSLVCDQRDRSGDIFVDGWIQRIAPSSTLQAQLTLTSESDRPSLYAQAGIWYDALAVLAKQYQAEPTNSQISNHWSTLLKSVGLDNLINLPLLPCCSPINPQNPT